MREISSDLSSHLAGQTTTICRCWKISRRDGLVLGFTEHDSEIIFAGTLFQPMSGMDASVAENTIGLNANGVEVLGALTSQKLSSEDIRADKYDGARVDVYLVNWVTPQEYLLENVYHVAEITEEDGLFKAEMRSLESELDQTAGEHFIAQCQANLGDQRCGVNLNSSIYKGSGTVISYDSVRLIEVTGLNGFADGWFDGGLLSWTSGNNSGTSIEIPTSTVLGAITRLQIWKMLPQEIAVGDGFGIEAGCDKKFSTCKLKFSNALNFRGFPHLPGSDFALSYASNSTQMDGGVIVQ